MLINKVIKLTKYARQFIQPTNTTHRQYEALRAYFVENLPSHEAAHKFGYSPGSFRVLCHQFRQNPQREFFLPTPKGPQKAPKRDKVRDTVIKMRKANLSVYDIKHCLKEKGITLSHVSISKILKEEGFARLPRRGDEQRINTVKPEKAAVADVRELDLQPRTFHTKFGGLFLFLPYLTRIPLDSILSKAGFPGSKMVPAPHAIRSLLGLKLFGNGRNSHVMSYVFDEGLALFAGLNVIPKRAFITEYSCRIDPRSYPQVMKQWFDVIGGLGMDRGISFDLDFHTIPFHGEDALMEKHYITKRSRRQKGILAFLVRDADINMFCYANASVRKDQQNDEIVRFVQFWKKRTGKLPDELIFDSKLTTYANLNKINKMNIKFITLRRRSSQLLDKVYSLPLSSWKKIELENVARAYRTPRIVDQKTTIDHYEGWIRQIVIKDLGHDDPTILITNQMTRSAAKLIGRYAKRMVIENAIADGIDFFHMDALSSAVAMKVDCDLQLTLMASSLYRLLGSQLGSEYKTAKSRHIFKDFIDATATIYIEEKDIVVKLQKRAHNPFLKAAGFEDGVWKIPWLQNKRLRFILG